MAYKFKYLIFREIPFNVGKKVAQIDVSHLNKKQANAYWDELVEKKYPRSLFDSILLETNSEHDTFELITTEKTTT